MMTSPPSNVNSYFARINKFLGCFHHWFNSHKDHHFMKCAKSDIVYIGGEKRRKLKYRPHISKDKDLIQSQNHKII